MRTSVITIFAAALLSASLATGKDKAVVKTTFKSKEDASQSISAILQRQGFRIEKTTSSKITAVFDPISTNLGPGDGDRTDSRRRDSANFRKGQRPQGEPGMGRPDRGQGGPGMGPGGFGDGQGGPGMGQGGPGSEDDAELPTVTVKLKKTSGVIKATFVGDIPEHKDSEANSGKGRRNGLARIVERVPNTGVTYK
ncbi:MAG: hypothetical protein LKK12_07825 [Bacteroidales bacterium]|jgi:hypothetical protein|nr:hypothetical protein [Bacteroidales bacterium]